VKRERGPWNKVASMELYLTRETRMDCLGEEQARIIYNNGKKGEAEKSSSISGKWMEKEGGVYLTGRGYTRDSLQEGVEETARKIFKGKDLRATERGLAPVGSKVIGKKEGSERRRRRRCTISRSL